MSFFTSTREKRLWLFLFVVMIAIYATLGFAVKFTNFLKDRDLLTAGFILCLGLTALAVLAAGMRRQAGTKEIFAWIGIFSVYLLMFLRMNIAEERGHLIEYSVVGIIVFAALKERAKVKNIKAPFVIAILITAFLGVLDESIQYFIPNRVFDPLDMIFNAGAGTAAILSAMLISWVRRRVG